MGHIRNRITALAATAATAATLGLVLAGTGPASAAGADVILVPSGFDSAQSDTRATGHYAVAGTGLAIRTEGATGTDKVAEYVATSTPLATVGEPAIEYTNNAGGLPGFQLRIDFDGNGSYDGLLVGERVYGNDWWLTNGSQGFVKAAAPSNAPGSGSDFHGTLDGWRAAFPDAVVQHFGFSLGSGVKGDGVIDALDFAGTRYTFAKDVALRSKDECKKGGWATSTMPVFKNQGDCVSYFATRK